MADFKLQVDESNKATELPLLRICGTVQQNPHMRAFWGSVFSFFLAFLGWFALAPLGLEVATSINMCENQKFPPAEYPLRPAYLKYKSLKTGLEYCQYGKVKDGDTITDCAAVPADVMSSATATAEEKSPYAPSVLAKCVCTTGTECNGMIANAGVAAVASTIFVRIALGTLLEARRLALLPLSLKKKAALATMTFSAISAWGVLFGGRVPTQKESNSYRNAFRVAVKGCAQKFDRSSRDLQQLVLLGHHSDLAFLACQRLLKAMGRWTALLVAQGHNPLLFNVKDSALARGMNACLAAWSWTPKRRSWAEWGFGNRSWNLRSTQALQNRAAHQLREDWRLSRLREWLGHPTRIDSRLARASRVRASAELVAYLRRLAAKVDGHALSTMIGGLSTDARWCPAGPQRDHCAICLSHTTPSVEHVFWQCPFFDEIRCQQPPRSALARRLGWSFPTDESDAHVVARLLMLGNIRCAEVKHRQHRATWTVRGAEAAAWAAEAVG